MSDRQDRGGRGRGGGDRSYHDDRRDRNRDYDRDRHRRRERDDDRPRDTGRDRDRDHRRFRSRSRDAPDRRRSRSPIREREGRDYERRDRRRDDRDNLRDRERDRDRERERTGRGDREDRPRAGKDRPRDPNQHHATAAEEPRQPTASPRRDAPEPDTQLPTRSKPPSKSTPPPAPVSFRVKGRDGSHGPDAHQNTSQAANPDEQMGDEEHDHHQQSRGRFDAEPMDEDEEDDVVVADDGMDDMAAMLGFGGFGTTKNKKVVGNHKGSVRKEKKTEYRQYMNRVGGFNRPLSPSR